MNVVLSDKAIDDTYSADIIAKARELSPELDEYVVTQRYLLEIPEEGLSPMWLRNKLMTKIVDQLNDRGIFINLDTDDLLDSPLLVTTALYLRSKFDVDNFYAFLSVRPQITEFIQSISDDVDCIGEIITYCNEVLPLDEGWEALNTLVVERPGLISSSSEFIDNVVQPTLDNVARLGDPDTVTEENRDVVGEYLGYLDERKQKITKTAQDIYGAKIDSSTEAAEVKIAEPCVGAVESMMIGFEKELARPNVVGSLDPTQKDIKLGDIRNKYLKKWKHTLAYWIDPAHQEEIPNELEFAVMVATQFVDFGGGPDARVKIIEEFESVADVLGPRYDAFRDLLDNALANLIMVKEGSVRL